MTVEMCPVPDDEPWPTLGPYVCDWIEEYLCHGPGDLLGQPVELSDEDRALLYRMYEVEPEFLFRRRNRNVSKSRNPRAGLRRFQRCALSLRKGSAKTEKAAWIAAPELHPEGPVRCAGFDTVRGERVPTPMSVTDPYIPMISYAEEQTEELAYGALRRILEECDVGNDFDIGFERIVRLSGHGKAEAVSASPNARDGARTTFQHADETHRFTSDKLRKAWTVMLANLAKRPLADPWALETTTAPEPGAGSVAERTMEYARAVVAGRVKNPRLFFFHRQADEGVDISTDRGLKKAIVEASGPYVAKWSDIDRIAAAFREPGADVPYLERVWLNRLVQSTGRAFDYGTWVTLTTDFEVPDGSVITLGFDGGRFDDATALVACHVESGHIWPFGVWPAPVHLADPEQFEAEVKRIEEEVNGFVDDAFSRWTVARMYCDPPKWESWVATWSGRYGPKRVQEWWTNRRRQMAYAIRSFVGAMAAAEMSHPGDPVLNEHIANARQQPTGLVDEEREPLWMIRKERKDSPKKIDAAMAAVLAWEARNDALAAGEAKAPSYNVFFVGG